jgi:16S rRNA (adenine1518-N6/adenine1519-N6)-dimethyltransferase
MQPLAQPPDIDPARLGELVTVAFSQRRKLLRHTLGRWLEQRAARGLPVPPAAANFDLQRRAEEVPVDEYLGLARRS